LTDLPSISGFGYNAHLFVLNWNIALEIIICLLYKCSKHAIGRVLSFYQILNVNIQITYGYLTSKKNWRRRQYRLKAFRKTLPIRICHVCRKRIDFHRLILNVWCIYLCFFFIIILTFIIFFTYIDISTVGKWHFKVNQQLKCFKNKLLYQITFTKDKYCLNNGIKCQKMIFLNICKNCVGLHNKNICILKL